MSQANKLWLCGHKVATGFHCTPNSVYQSVFTIWLKKIKIAEIFTSYLIIGNAILYQSLNSVTNIFCPQNIVSHTWSKLQPTGNAPSSRTAHAAARVGKKIFVHGGMSSVGTALDDVYSLDTGQC